MRSIAGLVQASGLPGPVADVGCGTGRVTGYLAELGLPVLGIDLSAGMLAAARQAHPALRFEEGSMLALDLPDGGLGGVLAWYSTIHVPDERLPEVFAEFHRVLAPGGHLLTAFQVGDAPRHRTEAFGHGIDLVFHRRRPEHVADLLQAAGLPVISRTVRERNDDEPFPEKTAQAFLLARKPRASAPAD